MTRDRYTKSQINMAIDVCGPDFKEQALAEARKLTAMGVKESRLEATILKHGFTEEEARYAMDNL